MYKIENFLLVKAEMSNTISVIQQFLKESSLLISNLYQTYIIEKKQNSLFPYSGEEYDASWYKSILVASWIIIDRLNNVITDDKPYFEILKNSNEISFNSFAKNWNSINQLCSSNLSEREWVKIFNEYKLSESSRQLQALIDANIQFDMQKFNAIMIGNTDTQPEVVEEIVEEVDDTFDEKIVFNNSEIDLINNDIETNGQELELVLQWLKANEIQIKKYRTTAHLYSAPGEYQYIVELLNTANNEINYNNAILSTIKNKLPNHPQLSELLELSKWTDDRNNTLSLHVKLKQNSTMSSEITNIEKEIVNIQNEIFLIEGAYRMLKANKPPHENLIDIENIINWVLKKEKAISKKQNI